MCTYTSLVYVKSLRALYSFYKSVTYLLVYITGLFQWGLLCQILAASSFLCLNIIQHILFKSFYLNIIKLNIINGEACTVTVSLVLLLIRD